MEAKNEHVIKDRLQNHVPGFEYFNTFEIVKMLIVINDIEKLFYEEYSEEEFEKLFEDRSNENKTFLFHAPNDLLTLFIQNDIPYDKFKLIKDICKLANIEVVPEKYDMWDYI